MTGGEAVCIGRQGMYGNSLCLLLIFAANLELLVKKKAIENGRRYTDGGKISKYDGVNS